MRVYLSTAFLMGALLVANAGQAVITSAPNDLTINAGSTANFIVKATNATSYQWMFQGANVPNGTNGQLNFSDVSTNEAGVYSVIVRSTGTNITNSANLTVIQGTIIQFQIIGFTGGPSNVLVELFDHDKPATVQNFLHYAISNSIVYPYWNMFFDRLIPGFVLQGGGWFAADQTNATPITTNSLGNIYENYTVQNATLSLPDQVASEFFSGPIVSNTTGTLAMALPSANVNGAANQFFFNLTNNPFLDGTNDGGPFTVFGRVLDGATNGLNVLQYFNNTNAFFKTTNFTRTPTHNIFTNGIFDGIYLGTNNPLYDFPDLPVNYHGANEPSDSSLFFVDFSFPDTNAQPVIDTNPPTAAISYPPPGMVLTNGIPLTVQGTAQDDYGNGLARVYSALFPLNGAYGDNPGGADAVGTTNWSLYWGVLEPGYYNIYVKSQDGAGNLSIEVEQLMIISAVFVNGDGSVSATDLATSEVASDAVGANLVPGTSYLFGAQPGPGQLFANWRYGTNVSLNPNLTLTMTTNMVLTANFVSNSAPGGLAFTSPTEGEAMPNGTFSIQGTVNTGLLTPPVTVTFRLFSYTNQLLAVPVRQIKATNSWSFQVANLALGHYYAEITAQDALGQNTVISNDFTAGYPLTLATGGTGQGAITTSGFSGVFLSPGQKGTVTATPAIGSIFENWNNGVHTSNSPAMNFTMTPGLVLTATFNSPSIPGAIAFTYPSLGGNTTNGTFSIQGTVNTALLTPPVALKCQLFSYTNLLPVGTALQTTATNNWSFPEKNLALGHYYVQVIATDARSNMTVITNDFTAGLPFGFYVNGNGRATFRATFSGQFLVEGQEYALKAMPATGSVFDSWSDGTHFTNNPQIDFIMTPGLVLTATILSNDIPKTLAFTYPTNGARLTSETFNLAGTITSAVTNPFVTYQLFYDSNSVTPASTNVTITTNTAPAKTTWTAGLTNLAPGYYTVVATAADAIGRTTLISESFQELAQVILQVNPAGAGVISSNSANWTGQYVSVGAPVKLTAITNGGWVFADWSNGISNASNPLTFTAETNATLTANFASNYFNSAAGAYYGLFYPTNAGSVISPANSGGCTVTLSSNAVMAVYLYFPGHTISFPAYSFPLYEPAGYATRQFVGKGPDGQPLTNYLSLDLTNGAFTLSGTVANAKFSSPLTAYRAATGLTGGSAVIPGNYVFSLPGDHATTNNLPGGDSYGTYTLGSNGAITLGGYLADNTAISPATTVATNGPNAWWPLYYSLYNGTGILLGWQTNTSPTNFAGWAAWSKPARAAGSADYTNAFLFSTNSYSSNYIPPVPGTQYQIAFGGSSVTNGLTNTLSISTKGLFSVNFGLPNTNQLTLNLTTNGAKTGALNGSFTYPTSKILHTLHGAFISPSQGGFGFFTDTNSQTGWFEINQVP